MNTLGYGYNELEIHFTILPGDDFSSDYLYYHIGSWDCSKGEYLKNSCFFLSFGHHVEYLESKSLLSFD